MVGAVCLLMSVSAVRTYRSYDRGPAQPRRERALARRLESASRPDERVIVGLGSRGSLPANRQRHRERDGLFTALGPVELYHARRKGWCLRSEDRTPEVIETLRARGARFFATWNVEELARQDDFRRIMDVTYSLVAHNSQWAIYRLERKAPSG